MHTMSYRLSHHSPEGDKSHLKSFDRKLSEKLKSSGCWAHKVPSRSTSRVNRVLGYWHNVNRFWACGASLWMVKLPQNARSSTASNSKTMKIAYGFVRALVLMHGHQFVWETPLREARAILEPQRKLILVKLRNTDTWWSCLGWSAQMQSNHSQVSVRMRQH